jgi:type III restriction enzyme
MILEDKKYQETAIEELTKAVVDLVHKDADKKVCVFQSPTGSGKTVMVAKFIETLISENRDLDFCFLWISIGKGELHKQSKKSLEKIFNGSPNCVLLEQEFFGSRTHIKRNEVVVGNWEKLRNKDKKTGEWNNKLMKDGEMVSFIEVLEKTKELRKIILIIDESHYASDTQRTNELREIVNADVTLEMSATPKIQPSAQDITKGIAKFVLVDPKDVIEQGMIKKEIIINQDLEKLADDEKTSQDVIMETAYNKRLELKEAYKKAGSDINPLCLIQLPNAEAGQAKKEIIEAFLANKGITENNGKLAIWLSEEKSDGLEQISHFESEVDFLLFKQAIDTGWDCPRAHILVKLRDIQSYTFEVQTVGRILRMPEQKHYEDENLNIGFIFTNLQTITVQKEEYNPNIIKHLKAIRKDIYQPLRISSYYKSRVDFGDLTLSFGKTLEKVFCEGFGIEINPLMINTLENGEKLKKQGLTLDFTKYKESLIVDKKIDGKNFDEIQGDIINDGELLAIQLAENDLQSKFEEIIKENLNGFAPKRSITSAREAIYLWFRKYLGIDFYDGRIIKIQNLFLHPKNLAKFSQLLSKATSDYKPIKKEEVRQKIAETIYDFEIKKEEFFNQYIDEKLDYKLCIYKPCYLSKERSAPEKEFEKYLETKENQIDWWFKNGSNKKDFLGIKYLEDDLPQTFYPDYIIKLKSGKIFIGDTKSGGTAKDSKLKAEALQVYIKNQNEKGKNLVGGIIVKDDANKWRVNNQNAYKYDKNDLRDWIYFDDLK